MYKSAGVSNPFYYKMNDGNKLFAWNEAYTILFYLDRICAYNYMITLNCNMSELIFRLVNYIYSFYTK